jgi:hypothetical protein
MCYMYVLYEGLPFRVQRLEPYGVSRQLPYTTSCLGLPCRILMDTRRRLTPVLMAEFETFLVCHNRGAI